ncbi:uncharacterized protein METZ01_LOCUS351687 [marine metagenome]|uniref:Uncharacterized protein n=1 Tax=marine metagenome TaxID=408172 RepID=A0A382RMA3_9ZZZZ
MQINFPKPDSGNFESGYIFLKNLITN